MDKFQTFVLHGGSGAELEVLAYGGKVKRLSVPDRDGRCENVAMSLDFTQPMRVGARRNGEYDLFPCAAFAFETQAHPDSINKPDWPDTILRPGQVFRSVTEYRFQTVR